MTRNEEVIQQTRKSAPHLIKMMLAWIKYENGRAK